MTAPSRFTIWVCCAILGVAAGAPYSFHPAGWALAGLAILAWLGRKRAVPLALAVLAAGFIYVGAWRGAVTAPWDFGSQATLTATVVAPPDKRPQSAFLTVQPKHSEARLLVKAGRYPEVRYGDTLEIRGTIEKPTAFSGFDYPTYLAKDRILGTVSQPKYVKVLGHGGGNPLLAGLYGLRGSIENTVGSSIPEPESGFLSGILLGSKRAIPTDLQNALQATGTSHIIAISGANITILLDILLRALPLYTLKRQFWATAFLATFVCLLTGASASVVRGGLIACLSRYARLQSRKAWALPLILTGMLIMLVESPLLLVADPGFQLSFAAFAGLAWLGAPCQRWLESHKPFSAWPEAVRGSLAETIAATIGTAPVSFTLFGQLSLLGFVVNPLILWLLPAVTLMGLILCAVGWIPLVAAVLQGPLWLCLHAILGTISWFGKLDIGLISWHPSWAVSLGLWSIVAILAIFVSKRARYVGT